MTRTQRDWLTEVGGKVDLNCGSSKKSARLEKSTRFKLSARSRAASQLHSTLLKFQPVTKIKERMAAELLRFFQSRLALTLA